MEYMEGVAPGHAQPFVSSSHPKEIQVWGHLSQRIGLKRCHGSPAERDSTSGFVGRIEIRLFISSSFIPQEGCFGCHGQGGKEKVELLFQFVDNKKSLELDGSVCTTV